MSSDPLAPMTTLDLNYQTSLKQTIRTRFSQAHLPPQNNGNNTTNSTFTTIKPRKGSRKGSFDPVCNDDEGWEKKVPSAGELGRIEENARESVATG
jgi:hypothetical protein